MIKNYSKDFIAAPKIKIVSHVIYCLINYVEGDGSNRK